MQIPSGLKECFLEFTDNDTMIIIGLFVTAALVRDADITKLIVGGLLAFMGRSKVS